MNKGMFSSKNHNWCTPARLFEKLNAEFDFTLDAAATHASAKCTKYFTPEEDGLSQSWAGERVFCNPPYGRQIEKWVAKAYAEAQQGTFIVLLIPARTDTKYFHSYIYGKAEIRFIQGRIYFEDESGETKWSAPFPSMLVIYRDNQIDAI